jgi:ferritin-like metal-binding protein YciE
MEPDHGQTEDFHQETPKTPVAGMYDSALKRFFIYELQKIYWSEKYLSRKFPRIIKAVYAERLKAVFESHGESNQRQIKRIEDVFDALGARRRSKVCKAIKKIVKDGNGIINNTREQTAARDVGFILVGRRIHHYAIVTYEELAKLAGALGLAESSQLFRFSMKEEQDADAILKNISETDIYSTSTRIEDS